MEILKNSRHERFCQLVAVGGEKTESFCQVYPRARNWKPKCRCNRASAMAIKLAGRIRELQEASASDVIASRNDVAKKLSEIINMPVADITAGTVIAAAALLAKLMGYFEQEKPATEHKFEMDSKVREMFCRRNGAGVS